MSRAREAAPMASLWKLRGCVPLRAAALRSDLRAGSLPDVQLIGGVGPYEIDVLVRRLRSGSLELVGQVTGAERIHEPVCGLPLTLHDASAEACVATTETDRFGEFAFHGLAAAAYVLALGSEADAPCMLIAEGELRASCKTAV